MADTVRTLSALQTLLADNTGGDISAQDLRDMLVSIFTPQMVVCQLTKSGTQVANSDATTTITFDGTHIDTDSLADLANNQIKITAAAAGYYVVAGAYAASGGATNNSMAIQKNAIAVANQQGPASGYSPAISLSTQPILLAADDTIKLTCYHQVGRTISATTSGIGTTWLAAWQVGQVPA